MTRTRVIRNFALLSIASFSPALFLSLLHIWTGRGWTWLEFAYRWGAIALVLGLAVITRPALMRSTKWNWSGPLWIAFALILGLALNSTQSAAVALVLIGTLWIITLHLHDILCLVGHWHRQWIWRLILAISAGALPVSLAQLESRFADEEFFVALEAASLSVFWLLLLGGYRLIAARMKYRVSAGMRFDQRIVALVFLFSAYSITLLVYDAYRQSFYSFQVPDYPKISSATPFICGKTKQVKQIYDGRDVFNRIVKRVELNPLKGVPEYGMLALATGSHYWADKFREAILQESAEGRFTTPAQSVKAGQFMAALRAYYYLRVRDRFPNLFSEQDVKELKQWFVSINRRALTPEWVDILYAIAFSKWPEGPYENQESGAGLLALLEHAGLSDKNLSAANRAYLARNQRGWLERFRVTDDAIIYHPEWIYNAYFQYLYTGKFNKEKARLAFEWLLLQALPDGAPLRYNHPSLRSWAGVAYLGAQLLNDPHYLWLAGRAVEYLERSGGYLFAPIGVEAPLLIDGYPPDAGSCLLYGDSGLPNQRGPLAPDKVVLRDGWDHNSIYLLINLRFTGWHRYKATGTLSLMYRNESLVSEILEGESFGWLPAGRQLFRDKRIPRENLNGLVVEKTAMSAATYWLTSFGGAWAQDPPHYAEVVNFETGENWSHVHIRIRNWRGWQHDRQISIQHSEKPRIIVTDTAQGPSGSQAQLVWHLLNAQTNEESHPMNFKLGSANSTVNMKLIPLDQKGRVEVRKPASLTSRLSLIYRTASHLNVVTIFEF